MVLDYTWSVEFNFAPEYKVSIYKIIYSILSREKKKLILKGRVWFVHFLFFFTCQLNIFLVHLSLVTFIVIDSSVKWIFRTESKYRFFFLLARLMHNLYIHSEQSSLPTKTRWLHHQGAMNEWRKKKERILVHLFPSIIHTIVILFGHVPTISCQLIDFSF